MIKKAKGHFVIIRRSSNQEDKIILDVFKGHVPIPDILIGATKKATWLEQGWDHFLQSKSLNRNNGRNPLQRHMFWPVQGCEQRHSTEYWTLGCSGKSRKYIKWIYTMFFSFCSRGCLLLAFTKEMKKFVELSTSTLRSTYLFIYGQAKLFYDRIMAAKWCSAFDIFIYLF